MENGSLITFIALSIIVVVASLYVGLVSLKSKKSDLKWITASACFGALSVVFCICRIFSDESGAFITLSSFSFTSIAASIYFFMLFVNVYAHMARVYWIQLLLRFFLVALLFDVVIWIVNPFCGWALGCEPSSGIAFFQSAHEGALYYYHLILAHLIFLFSMGMLFYRFVKAPKVFRKRYQGIIVSVLFFILLNFLLKRFIELEYSIHFYCLLPISAYWSSRYAVMDILNYFKDNVFETIEQGIVLFDFKGALIFHNVRSEKLLAGISFDEFLSQDFFVKSCNVEIPDSKDVYFAQCYIDIDNKIKPMRIDFHRIKDGKGRGLANLFVISDPAVKTDLLTGFSSWDSFKNFAEKDSFATKLPLTMIVCDLNNLSSLNNSKGRDVGDRLLRNLAVTLKNNFPQGSYFVRGEDAKLVVLAPRMSLNSVEQIMAQVKRSINCKLQYAVDELSANNSDFVVVIESATQTLNQKKLLDKGSARSELLTSLEKALQECDSDTEAHVHRTQRMGAALGKRIGLTDKQQSSLSLLCLLHDIGKIGVPLDILNKPGKLTDEEWNYIKTHVHKGYQIAKSSKGLNEIADMILHHHERWDGKGYPDGLKEDEIPLLSRIISVVDAFDAMVSNRSYRAAKSVDEAVAELERCSGTQFDPYLVKEFVPICRDMVGNVVPDEEKLKTPVDTIVEKTKTLVPDHSGRHNVHKVEYSRYVLNSRNVIIDVDDKFEKITGYSRDDIKEKTMEQQDLVPEEDLTEYLCFVSETLANNPIAYCTHRVKRKDGTIINVICVGKVVYDSASHETRSEILMSNLQGVNPVDE
ncbi:HD domain-containing phosphohydrolase [Fibrobacter sp. UWB12]|uniref:HD domain-containing phosphohydrolase n=1 Tax=Fibrobacter sp. UWB12 TaxID=1896203 RepID=UPI00091E9431|nr:HD domain-containing phosphohydrolase [Fibrobacter sp. UWB12]SHK87837.1 PAS domain S-box-containing protein [Fibrobacter sp. UWB12]